MSAFESLSPLDQVKVSGDTGTALQKMFDAMHEETGWCGDIMIEYWNAAYPVLREEMAKVYRPALSNGHRGSEG